MAQVNKLLTGTQPSKSLLVRGYAGDSRVIASIQGVWSGVVTCEISQDNEETWVPQANLTSNWSKRLDLKGGIHVRFSAVLTSGAAKVQLS